MTDISSVRDVLAKRREELKEQHTFDLDLPGYEDQGIVVRYIPLDYTITRGFGLQAEKERIKPQAAMELRVAMDTLSESAIDLLVRKGTKLESLGYRIDSNAAKELFGIENLPDGVPNRDALYHIVPKTDLIWSHFIDWVAARDDAYRHVEEGVEGNSVAVSPPPSSILPPKPPSSKSQ